MIVCRSWFWSRANHTDGERREEGNHNTQQESARAQHTGITHNKLAVETRRRGGGSRLEHSRERETAQLTVEIRQICGGNL
ncbi:hypothetical protein PoB_001463500 [Plakobranchus ocellatus]|uniref:Uncharacterized protein n=1 Tax=Plakobranchus ocellatus TaxID=259542 RepID=A0AAV3YY67_9GAST|nr:hypothetical protein PoB_001463500 [Plakobranchus ocellatus]